jgi:hypothetical protein
MIESKLLEGTWWIDSLHQIPLVAYVKDGSHVWTQSVWLASYLYILFEFASNCMGRQWIAVLCVHGGTARAALYAFLSDVFVLKLRYLFYMVTVSWHYFKNTFCRQISVCVSPLLYHSQGMYDHYCFKSSKEKFRVNFGSCMRLNKQVSPSIMVLLLTIILKLSEC